MKKILATIMMLSIAGLAIGVFNVEPDPVWALQSVERVAEQRFETPSTKVVDGSKEPDGGDQHVFPEPAVIPPAGIKSTRKRIGVHKVALFIPYFIDADTPELAALNVEKKTVEEYFSDERMACLQECIKETRKYYAASSGGKFDIRIEVIPIDCSKGWLDGVQEQRNSTLTIKKHCEMFLRNRGDEIDNYIAFILYKTFIGARNGGVVGKWWGTPGKLVTLEPGLMSTHEIGHLLGLGHADCVSRPESGSFHTYDFENEAFWKWPETSGNKPNLGDVAESGQFDPVAFGHVWSHKGSKITPMSSGPRASHYRVGTKHALGWLSDENFLNLDDLDIPSDEGKLIRLYAHDGLKAIEDVEKDVFGVAGGYRAGCHYGLIIKRTAQAYSESENRFIAKDQEVVVQFDSLGIQSELESLSGERLFFMINSPNPEDQSFFPIDAPSLDMEPYDVSMSKVKRQLDQSGVSTEEIFQFRREVQKNNVGLQLGMTVDERKLGLWYWPVGYFGSKRERIGPEVPDLEQFDPPAPPSVFEFRPWFYKMRFENKGEDETGKYALVRVWRISESK